VSALPEIAKVKERSDRARGRLFLVVGPSGAGKDTLIDAARYRFKGDPTYSFPKRYITRRGEIGEQHIVVDEATFAKQVSDGKFFLYWWAHGFGYGIASEIQDVLHSGTSIVVNVSRTVLDDARCLWPNTYVIHVTAERSKLAARIAERGRETSSEIAQRLSRTVDDIPKGRDVIAIDNSGHLEDTKRSFFDALLLVHASSG